MIRPAKPHENLQFASMGKLFRILAIADNDAEANAYMANHDNVAVIACFGPLIFMADKYDAGRRIAP